MKAIVQSAYGEPARVLRLADIDRPDPTDGQVLVRVIASSINAGDWRRVYASPVLVRFFSGMLRPKLPQLGGDAAGIVEVVGPNTPDLKPGDKVYGIRSGALAEYVAGQNFVRMPGNLSFAEAGIVPIAGVTALQALQKHGDVQPGQRVLITGAGGGVGGFAVQIAKALGAHVTATTSTDKLDLVRGLGADEVIDYQKQKVGASGEHYDLIVEIAGNVSVGEMRRLLAPTGRIVMVGAGRGGFGTFGRFIGANVRKRLGQPVKTFIADGPFQEQLATLSEMLEAGKIRPVIDRTYPLADVADAVRYAAAEKTRGKVAISVAEAV
jgi:NADPH:quinone reductase-like Zn-dependent oxidoreductase